MVAVAASEDYHPGDVAAPLGDAVDDEAVAGEHRGCGDLPVADRVVVGRVRSGEVDHELGRERVQGGSEVSLHGLEVARVMDLARELDGDRRCRLRRSPVAVVDRQREHGGIVGENGPYPVPVVQVEVDDEDPPPVAAMPEVMHRHRDVIEDAEALGAVGKSGGGGRPRG